MYKQLQYSCCYDGTENSFFHFMRKLHVKRKKGDICHSFHSFYQCCQSTDATILMCFYLCWTRYTVCSYIFLYALLSTSSTLSKNNLQIWNHEQKLMVIAYLNITKTETDLQHCLSILCPQVCRCQWTMLQHHNYYLFIFIFGYYNRYYYYDYCYHYSFVRISIFLTTSSSSYRGLSKI